MSVGYKKKDKDKDAKGASGGEASANYIIGTAAGAEGRRTNPTGQQQPASTTTDNNRLSTGVDISTTQKEKITSPSSTSMPSQDQISAESIGTTDASSSSRTTSTAKEIPYQYQYQQNYQQQQREEQQSGINRSLDETKDSIRKSVDIPRYTQTTNEYQEKWVAATATQAIASKLPFQNIFV